MVRGRILYSASRLDQGFSSHNSKRISWSTRGKSDAWFCTIAGNAVGHRYIPHLVHSDTSHPAMRCVGRERALLKHGGLGGIRISNFIPAHGGSYVWWSDID